MAAKKRVDPIKQREKRAKIAAGIGCLLFLVVAAIEVPSMLAVMNKKPPAGANATDAGNRNPDGSIPLPNVSVSSGLAGNGQLANTDVPPSTDGSQLVVFSVFETKNPFTPQATASTTPSTTTTQPTTASKSGADVPPTTTSTPTATTPSAIPSTAVPPAAGAPTSTTAAPPPTVAISVNGIVSHVGAQGTFPSGAPVFRLVSYTTDSAQVGIVGGSYATGGATLTLQIGKPVTLENTTDQKTYKLELVATH